MKKSLFLILLLALAPWVWSQDSWTAKSPFPGGARYGCYSFTIGDRGYMGGGGNDAGVLFSDLWEYNPLTDGWTRKADFPGGVRQFAATFSIGNKGYVATGTAGSYVWRKDVWVYDASLDQWRQLADFPGGFRYTAVGLSVGQKGYVGTGNYRPSPSVPSTYLKDWWEFDPVSETWLRRADVPELGRTNAAGIGLGDKAYVGMGAYYYDTRKGDWWEFDPASNNWTRKADLPGEPRYSPNVFTTAGEVYVASGYNRSFLADLYAYNPSSNTWTAKTYTPLAGRYVAQTFSFDYQAFMLMGSKGPSGYTTDEVWQYQPFRLEVTCPRDQNFCYQSNQIYTVPTLSCTAGCMGASYQYSITGATQRSGSGIDASGSFGVGESQIIWTITDAFGQTKSCTTQVEVYPPITSSIPGVYAVQPGGKINTLYQGYGPGCLNLQADVQQGSNLDGAPYQYLWSNGAQTSTVSVCPNTAGNYPYSVTITDKWGCSSTAQTTIRVVDVRCGNNLNKVLLCKKADDPKKRKELCIDATSVADHLKKDAMLGSCPDSQTSSEKALANYPAENTGWQVFPTVNAGSFMIRKNSSDIMTATVKVVDAFGKIIYTQPTVQFMGNSPIRIQLPASAKGMYQVQILSKQSTETIRILIQ